MASNQIPFAMNDKYIKEGLGELASDVSVPDAALAYKEYKKRYSQQNIIKPIIAAAIILLALTVTAVGPAKALNHIRQIITGMLTETDKLFQRSGTDTNEDVYVSHRMQQYDSLEELKKEKVAGIFIPAGLTSEHFTSSLIIHDSNNSIVTINLNYNEALLSFRCISANNYLTSGQIIDIEDFDSKTIAINNRNVTCFFDDKGYSILQWENSDYLFMFEGQMPVEELIKAGLSLKVFD